MESLLNSLKENCEVDYYINFLQQRANRCCCRYCAGQLEIRKLIYSNCTMARLELYCSNCGRIEFGTEKEIFERAKILIQEAMFDYYPDLNDCVQKQQMNTAKVCELADWLLKDMGLLTEEGFIDVVITECTQYESSLFEDSEVLLK